MCETICLVHFNYDYTSRFIEQSFFTYRRHFVFTVVHVHSFIFVFFSESLLNKRPLLKDVFDLTASHSSDWNDLGRTLQVSHNYRKQLRKEASSDKDKLEDMLEKWMETESVPVTWSSLIEALEAIELMDLVRAVKDFLKTPKAIRTYSKSCHS